MTLKQISPVETPALQGQEEEAVMMRLHTLFHLALAIGRREGLLGNRADINGSVSTKDAIEDQSDQQKTASRRAYQATGHESANSRAAPRETMVP